MSRPSILNDRGERESLPIVVANGRIIGVLVDGELVPFEPPSDEPSRWPSSWWRRVWPPW